MQRYVILAPTPMGDLNSALAATFKIIPELGLIRSWSPFVRECDCWQNEIP